MNMWFKQLFVHLESLLIKEKEPFTIVKGIIPEVYTLKITAFFLHKFPN